jgi:hypothetical protein
MTSANLTQTLLNKLQILPIQRQQQLLDGLEDEDLLTNISPPELQALANISLAPAPQAQLSDLLARNADGKASPEEIMVLDRLLEQVDQLNLLKARAKYTLQYLSQSIAAASTFPPSFNSKFAVNSKIVVPIVRRLKP